MIKKIINIFKKMFIFDQYELSEKQRESFENYLKYWQGQRNQITSEINFYVKWLKELKNKQDKVGCKLGDKSQKEAIERYITLLYKELNNINKNIKNLKKYLQ